MIPYLALGALYIGAFLLVRRSARREGREEALAAAQLLLGQARQEGVAEGAALIRAIDHGHRRPDDDECAIEAQRRVATWQ